VTTRRAAPVPGATVSFGGQRVRTGTSGRAALSKRFARVGVRRARASRSGFRTAVATVRIVRGRSSRGGSPRFTG